MNILPKIRRCQLKLASIFTGCPRTVLLLLLALNENSLSEYARADKLTAAMTINGINGHYTNGHHQNPPLLTRADELDEVIETAEVIICSLER